MKPDHTPEEMGAFAALQPLLSWLDHRPVAALAGAAQVYGEQAAGDPFRGMHLALPDAIQLLARRPGLPLFSLENLPVGSPALEGVSRLPEPPPVSTRAGWLAQAYELDSFEVGVLAIALAPEVDLRYGRLYAFLQDDINRRAPTVDLVLNLLCSGPEEKLACRAAFRAGSRLVSSQLIHVSVPPDSASPSGASLLVGELRADEQVVRLLLGGEELDARLAPFTVLWSAKGLAGGLPFASETSTAVLRQVQAARRESRTLRLHLLAPEGAGRRRLAAAACAEVGCGLLMADVAGMLRALPVELSFGLLAREAWLHDAALYLHGVDELFLPEHKNSLRCLMEQLAVLPQVLYFGGQQAWPAGLLAPGAMMQVELPELTLGQRADCWQTALGEHASTAASALSLELAGHFQLLPAQIFRAVDEATAQARLAGRPKPTVDDLRLAARRQTRGRLDELAQRVVSAFGWSDLVLPEDTLAQLHEICDRAAYRWQVFEQWGFGAKLSLGTGANALFAGPSGTGKTMAAGVLAGALGLDLYKIDLSGVVSKYIGETEKNLDTIFRAAAGANAVLFFDEADALFGKRSEVRDSHDRYANIEISYLLQKMEEYEGIAILATNLRQNLDEAFIRRLAFTVHFPFPDEPSRLRIWQGLWPAALPLAADVDLAFLAGQYPLSGGNIKNIALAAAFQAAADGRPVSMAHLLQAVRREYQKLGKPLRDDDFRMPGNGQSQSVAHHRVNGAQYKEVA